jgi:hypothetical protein
VALTKINKKQKIIILNANIISPGKNQSIIGKFHPPK